MNYLKTLALFALLLVLAVPAFSQAALTSTTLSTALADGSTKSFYVASATGITSPSFNVPNSPYGSNQTVLYVDKEAMTVTGVNGTYITVVRGQMGTLARGHNSGAVVYVGPPAYFSQNKDRAGYCVSTNEIALPLVNTANGGVYDCRTSNQWIKIADGTMGVAGQQIRGSCTGTAGSAETEYLNGPACSGATTATSRYVVAAYGTLATLRVSLSAAGAGGSGKDIVAVMKNGSATTLTCTLVTATSCADVTHSVAVVPGDVIQFRFISDTSDTAANVGAVVGLY